MEERFNTDFIIDYYGVGPDLMVSFPRLMAYLQEASVRHTDSTSRPMSWYADNGFGFLLTDWDVKVKKYPSLHDRIKIHTWPVFFKGIISERYFEMRDHGGGVCAQAVSRWVYTDLKRKRPQKPPEDLINGYGEIGPPGFEHSYATPGDFNGYEKISTNRFTVTRRDTDSNRHVNNVKYIEWAADYIPDEIYETRRVLSARAAYKKECVKGEEVFIETYLNRANGAETKSALRPASNPEIILFEARFEFTA